jgi:hypothetical protein
MDKPIYAKEFLESFNRNHPYISHELTQQEVQKWLDQKIIRYNQTLLEAMFEDYIMSQGFARKWRRMLKQK